jgi:type VI protein secretion system component Hcp
MAGSSPTVPGSGDSHASESAEAVSDPLSNFVATNGLHSVAKAAAGTGNRVDHQSFSIKRVVDRATPILLESTSSNMSGRKHDLLKQICGNLRG